MELRDYLKLVRKRWRIIGLTTLLALSLAGALTILSTPVYAAGTQFFVSTSGGENAAALQQGNIFTQARVKSYSQLLESPKVLQPVIRKAGLSISATDLADKITAAIPLDTVIIDVTVSDSSQERAVLIAQAIGEVFPETIQEIERVQQGQPSPVKVTVVKEAVAEPGAVSPKPTMNLALGLVLGLLGGFGVALLRDVLDQSVKTQADLAGITDKAILGAVPYDPDAAQHPLIVRSKPPSRRAESLRSVRTNLQFIDVENPPKSIVMTSSVPGEGKTTTAANLAGSLADTGASVLLVEADLRRPHLLEYLGMDGSAGLTDVLVGRVTALDVVQRYGQGNLSVLGAGAIPPNPSELLSSSITEELVKALTDQYDYVIIDAPPLLPVTDAAVLSTVVDGALVVVGAGIVERGQLRHALDSLHSVSGNVLGLILNRVNPTDVGTYGTYHYTYTPESERQRAKRRAPLPPESAGTREGADRGRSRER